VEQSDVTLIELSTQRFKESPIGTVTKAETTLRLPRTSRG